MTLADFFKRLLGQDPDLSEVDEPDHPLSLDELVPERMKVSECAPREEGIVAGTVVSAGPTASGKASRFEDVVDDESGVLLHATWLGQRELPGVVPGAILRLRGTLQNVRGQTSVIDPAYTILERGNDD